MESLNVLLKKQNFLHLLEEKKTPNYYSPTGRKPKYNDLYGNKTRMT